jgi:glycosyltransferase involved in cell wall biosynthesis
VRHLEDGLWIPYHHLRSVADGLRYLIRNPAAVERLGMAARERVRRRTWDVAAREMERVIRGELGCGRPPRAPP